MEILAEGFVFMRFETAEKRRKFFMEHVAAHESDLRWHLWKRLHNYHVVDDTIQSTMEKAWENLEQLKSRRFVKAWLFEIANNEVNQAYRKDQNRPIIISYDGENEDVLEEVEDLEESALEMIIDNFQMSIAVKALELMKPDEKYLIMMRYMEDMSQREMARVLGLKQNTLSSKLCRAVKKYRKLYLLVENGEK